MVMSDVQTEQLKGEAQEYPAILDKVTDDELVFVGDIIRKPRSLEGPAAERHDAWKKQTLLEVLGSFPAEASLFMHMGGFVAGVVQVLDHGSRQLVGQAALAEAIAASCGMVISSIGLVLQQKQKKTLTETA